MVGQWLECNSVQNLRSGIESTHIRVNFFSFEIEETYTLTTFVDQKLRFSISSKPTFDSLVLLGFFDCQNYLKKILDLPVI